MEDAELIELFRRTREAQRNFFRTREAAYLRQSKNLESVVDEELCRRDSEHTRLFGDNPVDAAIEIAVMYGGIDGSHHKAWVIDQMVRILAGERYDAIVTDAKSGEDGPRTYSWDIGIAP